MFLDREAEKSQPPCLRPGDPTGPRHKKNQFISVRHAVNIIAMEKEETDSDFKLDGLPDDILASIFSTCVLENGAAILARVDKRFCSIIKTTKRIHEPSTVRFLFLASLCDGLGPHEA
jgi:hypothetical protein